MHRGSDGARRGPLRRRRTAAAGARRIGILGAALTGARDAAHKAREQLRQGVDLIDSRERSREADRKADATRKAEKAQARLTLASAARDYHERVIEPRMTAKHAAQWISSLENHMPDDLARAAHEHRGAGFAGRAGAGQVA